jgi:hypothetical protein
MPRAFGKVSSSLWYSDKFGQATPIARMVYLWLITTDLGNAAGCFRVAPEMVPPAVCARRKVKIALKALHDVDLIRYDPASHIVSIGSYLRHCPINSWTSAVSAMNALSSIGDHTYVRDRAFTLQKTPGFLDAQTRKSKRTHEAIVRFYNTFGGEL